MESFPDISIIGPGKVGTALGVLAARASLTVAAVAGGGPGRAAAAAEAIDFEVGVCSPVDAAGAGGLVLLTVPDDAIADLCAELARRQAFNPGTTVAHCSGALGSDVLAPARDQCGCLVGSMHPLQTFPTVEAAIEHLPGTWCFCEGDELAVAVLERLAAAIGARPARVDAGAKALYHAAAVTACNYLVALLDAAGTLAGSAGVAPDTWVVAAEAIVRATVENVCRLGPAGALTGPIARGDVSTVARHVEAMAGQPEALRNLYRVAGMYTIELALRKGSIAQPQAVALREALNRPPG